ncbi:MAG: helix-turn-helix domain-containing protein [Candidatus Enteromonas sp.]
MNNIKKEFGKRLAEIRKSKKLRQEDLKELINAATIQMISNWENGHSFPSTSYLIILSKKLDVSLDYLLFGKENSPRNFEFRTYKDVCECITALIQDELFELGSYIDQNYMQEQIGLTYKPTKNNPNEFSVSVNATLYNGEGTTTKQRVQLSTEFKL